MPTIIQHGVAQDEQETIEEVVNSFVEQFSPIETTVHVFTDQCTGAVFTECHVSASKLVTLSTVDTPLDPEGQPDYRANRELVEDHAAYEQMVRDAHAGRTFSNIVCEFIPEDSTPLKIIGGQHRSTAIKSAFNEVKIDKYHGIKVYFSLDSDQRLDSGNIQHKYLCLP